jgi:hypothetical protein
LIADGRPEDRVQRPFASAATFMDIVNTPPEFKDVFGIQTPNPGVTRVHCPLLAFFGTNGDVGNEEDLELLKSSIKSPSRINTVMIEGADHVYAGQQGRVAQVIASWADMLLPANTEKSEVPKTPKANLLWWTKKFERQLHFDITIRQIITLRVVGLSPAI